MKFARHRRLTNAGTLINRLADKLSRVTTSGGLIPEVEGLRFIAISLVIFHHLVSIYLPASGRNGEVRTPAEWFAAGEQSWLVIAAYCGHFGVHLFFIISGFILALPFARRRFNQLPRPDLKSYFLRRVTRLEPPYILCLIIGFLLIWQQGGETARLFPHLIASLLYSHGLIYGEHSLINGVTWSLEIEIQFYLLVPLLVTIFKVQRAVVRRATILSMVIFFGWLSQWVIYPYGSARLQLSLFNYLHYFLTGFLLADLYLTKSAETLKKSLGWDLAGLVGGAAIASVLLRFGQFYFLLPLLVAVFYTGIFLGRVSSSIIKWRWIVIIGGMCYTIYLYHVLIISRLTPQTIQLASRSRPLVLDFLLHAALICIPLFIICGWLFIYAEKPFMRWKISFRRALPVSPAVEAE